MLGLALVEEGDETAGMTGCFLLYAWTLYVGICGT